MAPSLRTDLVAQQQVHSIRPECARDLPLEQHRRRLVRLGDLRQRVKQWCHGVTTVQRLGIGWCSLCDHTNIINLAEGRAASSCLAPVLSRSCIACYRAVFRSSANQRRIARHPGLQSTWAPWLWSCSRCHASSAARARDSRRRRRCSLPAANTAVRASSYAARAAGRRRAASSETCVAAQAQQEVRLSHRWVTYRQVSKALFWSAAMCDRNPTSGWCCRWIWCVFARLKGVLRPGNTDTSPLQQVTEESVVPALEGLLRSQGTTRSASASVPRCSGALLRHPRRLTD